MRVYLVRHTACLVSKIFVRPLAAAGVPVY